MDTSLNTETPFKPTGRVQRAVLEQVRKTGMMTTAWLACTIYNLGKDEVPTKAHRVAILRAAKGLVEAGLIARVKMHSAESEVLFYDPSTDENTAFSLAYAQCWRDEDAEIHLAHRDALLAKLRERKEMGEEEWLYRKFKATADMLSRTNFPFPSEGFVGLQSDGLPRLSLPPERRSEVYQKFTRRYWSERAEETLRAKEAELVMKQAELVMKQAEVVELQEEIARLRGIVEVKIEG